jgi:hypothetical protein
MSAAGEKTVEKCPLLDASRRIGVGRLEVYLLNFFREELLKEFASSDVINF